MDLPLDVVMTEVRHRFAGWQAVLTEESTQARQMLRTLLRGRLVFTPDLEQHACEYNGEGDQSELIRGLVSLPKALASPSNPRWNQILAFLREMAVLREMASSAA